MSITTSSLRRLHRRREYATCCNLETTRSHSIALFQAIIHRLVHKVRCRLSLIRLIQIQLARRITSWKGWAKAWYGTQSAAAAHRVRRSCSCPYHLRHRFPRRNCRSRRPLLAPHLQLGQRLTPPMAVGRILRWSVRRCSGSSIITC